VRVVGRGYLDAVRNLEVTLRSLGGGSKEKMQDWESIDLKKCLLSIEKVFVGIVFSYNVTTSPTL